MFGVVRGRPCGSAEFFQKIQGRFRSRSLLAIPNFVKSMHKFSNNDMGCYYDVQKATVAAFVGDTPAGCHRYGVLLTSAEIPKLLIWGAAKWYKNPIIGDMGCIYTVHKLTWGVYLQCKN